MVDIFDELTFLLKNLKIDNDNEDLEVF